MNTDNKRTTKEYPLPKIDGINIRTKYGALDKNNPEILYIRSRVSITPNVSDKRDFSDDIVSFKKSFEEEIRRIVHNSADFEDKHILTIEISENGITYGKKSHAKYDVFLKPLEMKELEQYHNEMLRLSYLFNQTLHRLLEERGIEII